MRKIRLLRGISTDNGVFGYIIEGSEYVCLTLERPWMDNQRGISCVPTGTYVAKRVSLAEHPHIAKIIRTPSIATVFELQGVESRSGIFIHPGNVYTDSEGCILVGSSRSENIKNGLPGITNSQSTFKLFMDRFGNEDELEVSIA